jgi:hypothetical protein
MPAPRKITSLAVIAAAASLALPGAALAKGGGGGGGSTQPSPVSTPPVLCDYALDGFHDDGSNWFSNQANDAGCITVAAYPAGYLRLAKIDLTPGWTYTVVSNGDGTNSRVQVDFAETATGRKVEARIEFGKTVIR